MSLYSKDVDLHIINLMFGNNSKYNTYLLVKMYRTFGGEKALFLKDTRDVFFRAEFHKHNVKTIEEFIGRMIKHRAPETFTEYKTFNKMLGNDTISFKGLRKRQKTIVKFMSLYHGYLPLYTDTQYLDGNGYKYFDFHSDAGKNEFTFEELRKNRVHNPKYYDVADGKYTLKKDAPIYKVGATSEKVDITCIKCI